MFRIVNLQEIIKSENTELVLSKIAEFSSLNEDVEYFIKNKAIDFEKRNFCRTFLLFDDNANLIAYFTLALKTLFFGENVAKRKKKEIQGFTSDISSVPVILIGQLSKNNNYTDSITGAELLGICMDTVNKAHNLVGGRFCLVETLVDEYNQKVVDFYNDNNFNILQKNDDETFYQLLKKLD
jgi:hypothetical protein